MLNTSNSVAANTESVDSIKPEFKGSGSEFFRIWIVNLFLTIVTFGVYIPWAKVRTRRYFYHATQLDGQPFDYTANPLKLLVGYLIVAVALISFSFAEFIALWVPFVLYIVFLFLFPWVRWKSLRFFATNSTYRHIPLGFRGDVSGAYAAFLGWPFLAAVTAGILAPFALFKARAYVYGNFRYGDAISDFRGKAGYFYKVCLLPLLGFLALFVFMVAGIVAIAMASEGGMESHFERVDEVLETGTVEDSADTGEEENPGVEEPWMFAVLGGMFFAFILFYIAVIVGFVVIQVLLLNYCWSNSSIQTKTGELGFRSRINPLRYVWILLSNIVLTALTLGIFIPFAMVRIHRYRVECLEVNGVKNLESVRGLEPEEVNALGETASDWLDLDFGL